MKKGTRILALLLAAMMMLSLTGCTSKAATETKALIDAIGEVTADSASVVEAAEAAYDALSDKDKEAVENIAVLREARETLDSALAVREAEELIDAIGTVTADSTEAVEAAQAAYDALSADEQARVSNASRLSEAREELAAAVKTALQQRMVGTWTAEYEGIDAVLYGVDMSLGELDTAGVDLGDYLNSFVIRYSMEFREDATLRIIIDRDNLRAQIDAMKEPLTRYYRDLFVAALTKELAAAGVSVDLTNDAAMKAAFGVDLDGLIQMAIGMSIKDLVDLVMGDEVMENFTSMEREGPFEVDETRLYTLVKEDGTMDYDTFELYELSGDTLTFTGFEGDADAQGILEGLNVYPIVFHRAG